MAHILLTPQLIKTAVCPVGKKKIDLFDSDCRGLMLEIRQSAGKTYYLRYQDVRGKTRHCKLANADDVILSQARTLADKCRNRIAMGEDPLESKALLKLVPTLSAFIHEQYLPFVKTYKRSWKTDEGLLRNHVEPIWGKRPMDLITKQDVVALITEHRKTHAPATCNRLLVLLRFVFNSAMKWEVAGVKSNPANGFPKMEENNKKERNLSEQEAGILCEAVAQSENKLLKFIVPMLILTGARRGEVLNAKWEDFDLERQAWRIPVTKSGKARHVPLSDGALMLLNTVPRNPKCPWVFANPKTLRPYVSIFCSWNTARKQAGLAEVRIHDLRHSFASFLVNAGRSLYEVQKILGHTQIKTTQRYSHLNQDTLIDAANAASKCIPMISMMAMPMVGSASQAPLAAH